MSPVHPTGTGGTFANAVVLVKREVFDALEACANAERALLRCGRAGEAAAIAALFEMLEDRVVLDAVAPGTSSTTPPPAPASGPGYAVGSAGSNSNDREFTQ